MKIIGIHQPQYFPYLGFFHKLRLCDAFVMLDNVQFQKHGTQNRNKIKTNQGWQWLTVPVLHRADQLILEVQINREIRFGRKHWNSIVTNYAKAPYFNHYRGELEELLMRDWKNLCELNIKLIEWCMDKLEIGIPLLNASSLKTDGRRTQMLVSLCQVLGADAYLSGPGGRRYMDLDAFESAGIQVLWQNFEAPAYEQLFPQAGFFPNLSILDTLFCCGPDTIQFLKRGEYSKSIDLHQESQDVDVDDANLG